MTIPKIISFKDNTWNDSVAQMISSMVDNIILKNGKCSLMLTGGRSAKEVYRKLSKIDIWNRDMATYYFGDERCVSLNHNDSNYKMTINALFSSDVVPDKFKFERIKGEAIDLDNEAYRYALLLPKSIDILLLSVGSDGHIASLFPFSESLNEIKRSVVVIKESIKTPLKRITITPKFIKLAKNIIVMAEGKDKGEILADALQDPDKINELPVRLTISKGTTWVLDHSATKFFEQSVLNNHYN